MATRFYFPSSETPAPTVSPTFDSSWEATGSAIRLILEIEKNQFPAEYATKAVATSLNSPAGAVDVLLAQYTSAPLSGAQTISGAIKGQVRAMESSTSGDLRIQCVIWVRQSDGSNRGTLISSNGSALSSEFNTSLRNIKIPLGGSTVPSSVSAQDGDRIVVEIGYRKHESATSSRTGTFDLGAVSGATDLPEDETTTTQGAPWIEFADTLTFQSSSNDRVSQSLIETAVLPSSGQARLSQSVAEAVVSPTSSAAWISQSLVEVVHSNLQTFSWDFISSGTTLFGPKVNQLTIFELITQAPTVYEPTAKLQVSAQLIDQTAVVFSPIAGSPAQFLDFDLITNATSALDIGEIKQTFKPPIIDVSQPPFAPSVNLKVVVGLIDQSATCFEPELIFRVNSDLVIEWSNAVYIDSDLSISYSIIDEASSSLTVDWMILDSVQKSLTIDWAIDHPYPPGASLPINYLIGGDVKSVILYDGQDVTPDVLTRGCEFITRAGGTPGTASVYLLVQAGTEQSYIAGKTLDLKIDDDWMWRGRVTRVTHESPFHYDSTVSWDGKKRFLRLEGTDINVLFEKRIVFNQADPTKEGPIYSGARTPDTVALTELLSHWLDLSSDDLDTVSMVDEVGYINVDQPGYPFIPTTKWGDAMRSIASLSGSIFYIDPDRRLVYTDVDTQNSSLVFSDTPAEDQALPEFNGYTVIGYREMRVVHDAGDLVNDYLAWGLSGASSTPVFKRTEDSDSITEHGRWQGSALRSDIYKQGTLDLVSNTYVYGSPSNKRGHKDPKPFIYVKTFNQGFRVAQKVRFISHVFGIDDVYPIRQIIVSFPDGFKQPVFSIQMSHEIDYLNFSDPIRFPSPNVLPPVIPPTPPRLEYAGIIIDSFSRELLEQYDEWTGWSWSPGWGTGEQVTWEFGGGNDHYRVQGGAGKLMMKHAEYPLLFEGSTKAVSTDIPLYAVGGEHDGEFIDVRNLLIKFRIGRDIRTYPRAAHFGSSTGKWLQMGIPPCTQIGCPGWRSHDPGYWCENWDEYSDPIHGVFVYSQHMNGKPCVSCEGHSWRYSAFGTGGDRGLMWGKAQSTSSSPHHGGGMVPWMYRYAGGTTKFQGPFISANSSSPAGYGSGPTLHGYCFAGPDDGALSMSQKMYFQIDSGGQVLKFDRSSGEVSYPTPEGLSDAVFGVYAGETPGAKAIYADHDYYLRWYRPNEYGSFTKIWYAGIPGVQRGSSEPADWFVSEANPGWDDPNNFDPPRELVIQAIAWPFQSYVVEIDEIRSFGGEYGLDDQLPWSPGPVLPFGTYMEEIFDLLGSSVVTVHWAYIPGTVTLYVNGTIQRRDLDFTETTPSLGVITLLFTPSPADKIEVQYYTA